MVDRECTHLVDIAVWSTVSAKPPRTQATRCAVTPKRIYTMGGAVFNRQSGAQILRLEYRVWGEYKRKALPETIRLATTPANSAEA